MGVKIPPIYSPEIISKGLEIRNKNKGVKTWE